MKDEGFVPGAQPNTFIIHPFVFLTLVCRAQFNEGVSRR